MWRIESRTDPQRWVEYGDGEYTADRETAMAVKVIASGGIPLTPTGPLYTPTGDSDETALFLASVLAVPAPDVSGRPPSLPRVPAAPDDRIF